MPSLVLNFAYGTGPFLRTVELALAINDCLEQAGRARFKILVPWVYGEKQKQIMREEFGEIIDRKPEEILLEKALGNYLKSFFFGEKNYEASLEYYLDNYRKLQETIESHFANGLTGVTFSGQVVPIAKKDIALSIARAPRVSFPVKPAYYTSFAYISEILEHSLYEEKIAVSKTLLKKVIPLYKEIEDRFALHFIAEPGTFSYLGERPLRYQSEISTPPNAALPPRPDCRRIEKGLYVTVTGIPGLDHLFREASKIGLQIYTNKPDLFPGSRKASPGIIGCRNILLHLARSGWGAVWLSLFHLVPFITPEYDKDDDPEIYFNNLCLEKMGLGQTYRGQPLQELLEFGREYRKNAEDVKESLIEKYGTLDGLKYTAQKIIEHYSNL